MSQILICNYAVGANEIVFIKIRQHGLDFIRHPYIVLVAKKQYISFCQIERRLKIQYVVFEMIEVKMNSWILKRFNYRYCGIGRAIIADHQLVVRT